MAARPAPTQKAPAKKGATKKSGPAALKAKPVVGAPKTKAAAPPVVTLKAIFEQLGETHILPKKQAHGLLADFVAVMTKHLAQGERIRMSGLGILKVKTRAARTGRNPATSGAFRSRPARRWDFDRPRSSWNCVT